MKNYILQKEYRGLQITTGKMVIVDPCEDEDERVTLNVRNGEWIMQLWGTQDYPRPSYLIIRPAGKRTSKQPKWTAAPGMNCGSVDSGTVGVMDEQHCDYAAEHRLSQYADKEWACALEDKCYLSATENGDGAFSVYVALNRAKEITAIKVWLP